MTVTKANKRAKMLETYEVDQLREHIRRTSPMPERDDLFVLLSFRAGLRAAEISKIDISAMTDASGRIAGMITIYSNVAKKGRYREIPMHPQVADALARFRRRYPNAPFVAISPLDETSRMSPNAVTLWFWKIMRDVGFKGASSHSGRRTFGTTLARTANLHGGSLRDVQTLLGHARLETTENYIEPSQSVFGMVAALGG